MTPTKSKKIKTYFVVEDRQTRTFESPRDKSNKMACAPIEDSDQPGHQPSLIRADAQADLSLRWTHMSFCRFCHEAAHLHNLYLNEFCTIHLQSFKTNTSAVLTRKSNFEVL